MSIKDKYNKKVTFDMQDRLEEKIDRLTVMMSKLMAYNDGTNKQFKLKKFQSKKRGQTRSFYDKSKNNLRNYQNSMDQVMKIEEFHLVVEFSMDKITEID